MDFDFLRDYLKKHKITRQQFANDIGVPIGTINTWFTRYKKGEQKKFPDDIAVKIATVYQIPLDYLIGGQKAAEYFWSQMGVKTKEKVSKEAQKMLLLSNFDKLNVIGRDKAIDAVELLTRVPEYKRNSNESDDSE